MPRFPVSLAVVGSLVVEFWIVVVAVAVVIVALVDMVVVVEVAVAVVAVVALPFNAAVIVPAEKLPEVSRDTIVFAVFALVAVVAEFATLPEVLMVASFESVIPALAIMSALVTSDVDRLPDASL